MIILDLAMVLLDVYRGFVSFRICNVTRTTRTTDFYFWHLIVLAAAWICDYGLPLSWVTISSRISAGAKSLFSSLMSTSTGPDSTAQQEKTVPVSSQWMLRCKRSVSTVVRHARCHVGSGIVCSVAYFDPFDFFVNVSTPSHMHLGETGGSIY